MCHLCDLAGSFVTLWSHEFYFLKILPDFGSLLWKTKFGLGISELKL